MGWGLTNADRKKIERLIVTGIQANQQAENYRQRREQENGWSVVDAELAAKLCVVIVVILLFTYPMFCLLGSFVPAPIRPTYHEPLVHTIWTHANDSNIVVRFIPTSGYDAARYKLQNVNMGGDAIFANVYGTSDQWLSLQFPGIPNRLLSVTRTADYLCWIDVSDCLKCLRKKR